MTSKHLDDRFNFMTKSSAVSAVFDTVAWNIWSKQSHQSLPYSHPQSQARGCGRTYFANSQRSLTLSLLWQMTWDGTRCFYTLLYCKCIFYDQGVMEQPQLHHTPYGGAEPNWGAPEQVLCQPKKLTIQGSPADRHLPLATPHICYVIVFSSKMGSEKKLYFHTRSENGTLASATTDFFQQTETYEPIK